MSPNFEHLLSQRTNSMRGNAIRDILKVVSQPGMISLAGGIPAPQSFPLEEMYKINDTVLDKYGTEALQYDFTEGFAPLRHALVDFVAKKGIQTTFDDITVYNGSQSVLDIIGKILITPNDIVALESPSYLGAISAFNAYEPQYVAIDTDDDGIIPESLEQVLSENSIKFIYMVSTFQNPTGRTLTDERRQQMAEIVKQHGVLVVEDDPYSALRFRGEPVLPFYTYAPENTIYVSTVSKTFAPGLRVGFCIAPPLLREWLSIAKQGADLHTNTYAQALATEYLTGGYAEQQLPKIINLYKPRQEAMLSAMEQYLPDTYRWTKPDGGMFIWVEGPDGIDAEQLYWKAVERKIAFVPGKFFFIKPEHGLGTMRLNFTKIDEDTIDEAIKVLGEVIQDFT
jgi:2-aminoadipate transaminase